MQLRSNVFVKLDDVKDFLKITGTGADNTVIYFMNMAADYVEKYLDRPVLARQFIEFFDGNSSNTIVPTYNPILRVVELRIDFNRAFDATTPIDKENIVIRGLPAKNQSDNKPVVIDAPNGYVENPIIDQLNGNFGVQLQGQDIVLRDDNNTAILGRLFSGSVLQSIMVTYIAGLAETHDQVPFDLIHATMMLTEYYYLMRENRTMNLKSKESMQQSYEFFGPAVPKDITDILDSYKDYGIWMATVPAKNIFTL